MPSFSVPVEDDEIRASTEEMQEASDFSTEKEHYPSIYASMQSKKLISAAKSSFYTGPLHVDRGIYSGFITKLEEISSLSSKMNLSQTPVTTTSTPQYLCRNTEKSQLNEQLTDKNVEKYSPSREMDRRVLAARELSLDLPAINSTGRYEKKAFVKDMPFIKLLPIKRREDKAKDSLFDYFSSSRGGLLDYFSDKNLRFLPSINSTASPTTNLYKNEFERKRQALQTPVKREKMCY